MTRAASSQQLQEPQAVAGLPRLFVGQVPTNKHEQDLLPIFSKFGEVETIMLVRGPDQKSRGCAMVQFRRWAEAEAAMENLNGTSPLEGSKGRPLVVNFANPRRGTALGAGEFAITPRKLFIGQILRDCSEEQLLALFRRFGEIESLNIVDPKGQQTTCAFIQYKKWAACEAAIDQLNEQYLMPGAEHPLVVKFADARRGGDTGPTPSVVSGQQNSSDSSQSQGYVTTYNGHGSMYSSAQSRGNNGNGIGVGGNKRINNGGAPNNGNSPGVAMAPPNMHYMPHPGMLPHGAYMGHPSELAHHLTMQYHHHAAAAHPGAHHPAAMGILLSGLPGVPGLLHGGGRRRGGKGTSSSGGAPSSRRGGIGSSCDNASTDSLGDVSDGSDNQQHLQGGGVAPMHPMHAVHDMNGAPMHHQYMHAVPAAYMGYPMMHGMHHPMMGMPPGGKVGRGVADPVVYAHKLFVGQVPFEATEQDLWMMFAPFGDILELAVLRSGGMSKGCAFLTYASKQQALSAMSALHGQHVGANKRLVVKFADHKPQGNGVGTPTVEGATTSSS